VTQSPEELQAEIARLKRRLERERATRFEAEAIAEKGLRELYDRQRELMLSAHIASAANQNPSAHDVLQFAAREICSFAEWELGHALLVENGVLRSARAWHSEGALAAPEFQALTEQTEFPPGIGLPGRALATRKPVWIADLSREKNFPRLQTALECGVRCACAFPVLSGNEVVAVLEFFGLNTREPDQGLIEVMAQLGNQLGRAIERQTARERLEQHSAEMAVAHERAMAADRAKSAFLANMSHELRTPLNAIIGFSEVMIAALFGPLTQKYLEYARDINAAGTHLKNVLNDILDLSKIDAGAMQLRAEPTALEEIADSCRRIITPLAAAARVNLSFTLPETLPLFRLDRTRFTQALINIVSNAVKFTPEGGRVTVTAESMSGEWVIRVADTGIGMTEEGIALALQPFRQVDSALNRRFEGTGLGLPLAKALLELHGGRLSIESTPGKGTIVRFHLPAGRLAIAA
jgi:signal transduction histidine kinase